MRHNNLCNVDAVV